MDKNPWISITEPAPEESRVIFAIEMDDGSIDYTSGWFQNGKPKAVGYMAFCKIVAYMPFIEYRKKKAR